MFDIFGKKRIKELEERLYYYERSQEALVQTIKDVNKLEKEVQELKRIIIGQPYGSRIDWIGDNK